MRKITFFCLSLDMCIVYIYIGRCGTFSMEIISNVQRINYGLQRKMVKDSAHIHIPMHVYKNRIVYRELHTKYTAANV